MSTESEQVGEVWRGRMLAYLEHQRELHQFSDERVQEVFRSIYLEDIWGNPETRSGWGSTTSGPNGTERIRAAIGGIFKDFDVASILDAPCGDFNWMQHLDLGGRRYVGVDIVPEVVERNRLLFARPDRQFECADIIMDCLPEADLAIVRDVLIHLTNEQAVRALKNVLASQPKYLLISNYAKISHNGDTFTGGLRLYNLRHPPFSEIGLPEPIAQFRDGDGNEGRQMVLFGLG